MLHMLYCKSEIIWIILFHYDQIQKSESTRNRIGFQYSLSLNELYVRDVFVLKFHTSVVTLKITKKGDSKQCNLLYLLYLFYVRTRCKCADYL